MKKQRIMKISLLLSLNHQSSCQLWDHFVKNRQSLQPLTMLQWGCIQTIFKITSHLNPSMVLQTQDLGQGREEMELLSRRKKTLHFNLSVVQLC